jgi:hypothetical protein
MIKLSYTFWFNKLVEIESQITSNNHKTAATVFTMFDPNSHVCTFTTSKICKYTPIFESASGEGGARTPTFGFPQERGSDYSPFYLNLAKLSDCPRPALKFNAWNPVPICCDTNICTSSALLAVYNNNAANIIPRAYLPPQQTNTRRPASSITRERAPKQILIPSRSWEMRAAAAAIICQPARGGEQALVIFSGSADARTFARAIIYLRENGPCWRTRAHT